MYSSSHRHRHRHRQWYHHSPARRPPWCPYPEGGIQYGNQVVPLINIMNSSSHRPPQWCTYPEGGIQYRNQVTQPINIMNSSSHRPPQWCTYPEGSIQCGNQVEQPINMMNSQWHHHSPAENMTRLPPWCTYPEGSIRNQPIHIMNSSSHHHSPAKNMTRLPPWCTYPKESINNQPIHIMDTSLPASMHIHIPSNEPFPYPNTFECGNVFEEQLDVVEREDPERYQNMVNVCKFALDHYNKYGHPQKSFYKLASLDRVSMRAVAGVVYYVAFKAINMEDGKLGVFKAVVYDLVGKEMETHQCELLE